MTLAEELGLIDGSSSLWSYRLNHIHNVQGRIDEIVEFIASSDRIHFVHLNAAPIEENLGRRISQAITSNSHIKEVQLIPSIGVAIRDVLPWMTARGTLEHMTSLQKVSICERETGISVQDWDLIFPLLLTSTSLQELQVHFRPNHSRDAIMSVISHYLLQATSLVHLKLTGFNILSQSAMTSLYNSVAQSSLRKFTLECSFSSEANRKAAAECLALAIAQSSLEEVLMNREIYWALLRTIPVKNLDFAFSQIGVAVQRLKINRKWKPLLTANIPLGLWPRILHKAHASPETSHGREGILFYFLREKPDLVPGNSF